MKIDYKIVATGLEEETLRKERDQLSSELSMVSGERKVARTVGALAGWITLLVLVGILFSYVEGRPWPRPLWWLWPCVFVLPLAFVDMRERVPMALKPERAACREKDRLEMKIRELDERLVVLRAQADGTLPTDEEIQRDRRSLIESALGRKPYRESGRRHRVSRK